MRTAFASAVTAALFSAALAGQQTPASRDSNVAHKTYILTGCLLMSGTPPATKFALTDATAIGQTPPTATEPRPVPTSGEKLTYTLKPETGVTEAGVREEELRVHAGQRVQVTIREEEAVAPPPQRVPQQATSPPAQPAPQEYTVTAIKLVSGSCL